jgi:predicted metal-dependent hydrolase
MTEHNYDPHYLEYFARFNRQEFFEAHEVLETLWHPQRQGANAQFYKGLIQLAGAFVHLQKNRLDPAAALFGLARANLRIFPGVHEGLEVDRVLEMIEEWLSRMQAGGNPFTRIAPPQLQLG